MELQIQRMIAGLVIISALAETCSAEGLWPFLLPEQPTIAIRDPSELIPASIPRVPRPPSVSNPQRDLPLRHLSLNEAISTGLANSEVVRVLAGVSAASSGRTIYDVAISNTRIDQEQAAFDPTAAVANNWLRSEQPLAAFDPLIPGGAFITGTRSDSHLLDFGLTKQTSTGGSIDFGVNSNLGRNRPGFFPLNPQGRSSVDLSYTQPLLQGRGIAVNRVPIVVARIDTERSFFQYKQSVQRLVRGIIDAYWSLVFARADVWSREQQVAQATFANSQAEARFGFGMNSLGVTAQTRVALENFRVTLLGAEARLLDREAALRNILGFPPYDANVVVPVTPASEEELDVDWHGIVDLAEERRPDLIELKLVLEADQQLLLQSENSVHPRVDAVALYRWNGLEGTMPTGPRIRTQAGQFADWTLGVNFSVPIGLRRERAALRRQELVIARDRANLEQGLHQTSHILASSLRSLDLSYQRYRRFQTIRTAAKLNLDQQMAEFGSGRVQFVTVLQAIVDWGNAVSSEALSLTQYNTEIANLELETGTILESHGIAFYEERYGSLGPFGRLHADRCYATAMRATPSDDRYPSGERPAEEGFDLRDPLEERAELPSRENEPPNASRDLPSRDLPSRDLPSLPPAMEPSTPVPQLPAHPSPLPATRLPATAEPTVGAPLELRQYFDSATPES